MLRYWSSVLLLVASSCTTAFGVRGDELVTVNVVGSCPTRALPDAVVELRAADGRVIATSTTGVDGAARFSRKLIGQAGLVIACHDDYFCGALKLREFSGDQLFIALAPVMVSRVAPPGERTEGPEPQDEVFGVWAELGNLTPWIIETRAFARVLR